MLILGTARQLFVCPNPVTAQVPRRMPLCELEVYTELAPFISLLIKGIVPGIG